MQPATPPLFSTTLSRSASPCQLPDSDAAAILVLVNKPDTHYYPIFHAQKDPPPDLSDIDMLGNQITPYDQIAMGSDVDSDLRMFFAEPKHCSLIVDSLGNIFVINFSSGNPCLLNNTTLTIKTLHPLENLDVIHVAGKNFRVEYKPGYPKAKLSDAITSSNLSQIDEVLEDLEKSADLETIYPLSPAKSPKVDRLSIRSSPRKQISPHSSPGGSNIPPSPRKYVTYSSPTQSSTPANTKRSTTPLSASDSRSATHDATDNSYASMEVNTSQPSLIARDMSTTMNVSVEPSTEKRRLSDFPKETISSPVKLKRKSAPITFVRISPRFSDHKMDSPNNSGLRRSTRTQQTPQKSPSKSYLRKSPRESLKTSPPISTPKKYPSTYKHPNSTGLSARRSRSPLTLSSRKSVRFGPSLSPEEFCRNLPPSTPVKRGGTPITRSATKAVLRRSTPYKLPLSVATQFSKLSPKAKFTTPNRLQNSPKLSPRQSLSKNQFSTPKSPKVGKTITPLKETKSLPVKSMTSETMLRRGLRSAVLSEMKESHNLKLSSRISTPTSIHSKLPTQQAKASLLITSPRLGSKSPDQLLSPKGTSVSPSNKSGELEFQQSAKKRHTMSPLQNYPAPTRISLPRKSKSLDLSSSQITTPDTVKLSPSSNQSIVRAINSPKTTPKMIRKTPEAGILPKLTEQSRKISLESPFRMSQRLSKSPDLFQSPPLSGLKHQVVTPVHDSYGSAVQSKSISSTSKSPAVQSVEVKSPALSNKSPAISKKSPAVLKNSPAVSKNSPAVSKKSPAVSKKSPAVSKSPAIPKDSHIYSLRSPTIQTVEAKPPAIQSKSSAISNKSPAVHTPSNSKSKSPGLRSRSSTNQTDTQVSRSSSAKRAVRNTSHVQISHPLVSSEFERSIVHDSTPKLKARTPRSYISTPSTNNITATPLSARVASPRSNRSSPLPKSPRRGRSLVSSKVLRLAWVSPTCTRSLTPRVAPLNTSVRVSKSVENHTHADTPRPPSRRSLRDQDVFNPRLFDTPKIKVTDLESNFRPSLFNTPVSPRSTRRATSAPQDSPSVPQLRRKRTASLPKERTPRKKHSAQPEDTFYPYLFRTPRIKPVHTPSKPEEIFLSDLFKSPPTPLLSHLRGAAQKSSRKTPSKAPRPNTHEPPEVSPLVLRETRVTRRGAQVEKTREVKKRVVNKNAPSSPAKVIIVSPPKSPSTSPFMIRTKIKPLSPSPLPVRITRNRISNRNTSSMAKKSVKSTVTTHKAKLVRSARIFSPMGKAKPPIPKMESSPSPPPVRILRQRNATSTKPVAVKTQPPSKIDSLSPPSPINKRVLRSEKQTEVKGILKILSRRQVSQPQAKNKVTLNLSPMAPKLSNSKRVINEVGRTRAATVSFALSPSKLVATKSADSPPKPLVRTSTRSYSTRITRSSRAK
ncbi:hypothetical protein LOD99_1286 [Oopsacas minuta]|uniref:PP1-binding domain-containing protein n=1 Tax=Oopsacas minuta TaxID=111878 RepID=A0AAV7K698_9METZ|nr:hypothetical protein LOD99_1286 [Oopsacas minuta]